MPTGAALDPYDTLQVVPTADQEVIHAAYRALALKYHPDRDSTRRAADKMGNLNRAYGILRDERSRAAFDRSRRAMAGIPTAMRSVQAGPPPPTPGSGSVLHFGRYTGWSLRDLARHDPDYILWLSRHSSGIRYRTEIYGILRTIGVSTAA